jgi:hypothetical protein
MTAYLAMARFMLSKHLINPYYKFAYFQQAKDLLERAILADPSNVEIRYLRLTVQISAPSFLGYSDDIERDSEFLNAWLADGLAVLDPDLKKRVDTMIKQKEQL